MHLQAGGSAPESYAAVITGGASGIGRACADRLARAGQRVAILDLDGAAAESAARALCGEGAEASGHGVDVTDRAQVDEAMRAAADQLGPIGVLINSAGIAGSESFRTLRPETWTRMIAINLTGTFNCAQAVAGSMLERRHGRIINISSYAGQMAVACLAHYSAAKGGVIAFTKALARELGPYQVTVNVVCPGGVETPMLQRARERATQWRDDGDRARPAAIPPAMGRVGTPEEVASVCEFLASSGSGFVTGQAIGVNGGTYM